MAKTKTLTEGTPWKLLLSFSIPILIGQVVQLFYSLVDTKVVGATLGELALASVGSVSTLYNLTNGFANGLTMGFAIIIAMYFGRKDEKNLKKAFAADILLAFQYQDMDSLANLAGYPLQVNLGEEEMTAEDGGAFLSLSKGQIFTEERVQAVVNCNLYALEELDGERYVLGAEEGGPNVIFQKDSERDSGFTIVEIN